ncbi:MAG: hypothetical protein LC650_00315 [Actinobacteria bacterium]|nr:hypothetical protein [Actinomycetota bacterium]
MDKYGPQTAEDHLRTARATLIHARQFLYAIDEGRTTDGVMAATTSHADEDYLTLQNAVDDAIIAVAHILRKRFGA